MASYVQVSFLCVLIIHLAGLCSSEYYVVLDSVECTCLTPICGNSTCQLEKLDKLRGNVTVGGLVTKKLKFVKFRVRRRTKNEMNKWSNEMDFTIDYCDFAKGASNPIINVMAPGIRQVLGETLRPCPFQGWFLVKYTADPSKKETNRPFGQLVKTEVMLMAVSSQVFFKVTLLSKVE